MPVDGQDDNICQLTPEQLEDIASHTEKFQIAIDEYVRLLSHESDHDRAQSTHGQPEFTQMAVKAQKVRIEKLKQYLKINAMEYAKKKIYLAKQTGADESVATRAYRTADVYITSLMWSLGKLFVPIRMDQFDKDRRKILARLKRVKLIANNFSMRFHEGLLPYKKLFLSQISKHIEMLRKALSPIASDDEDSSKSIEIANRAHRPITISTTGHSWAITKQMHTLSATGNKIHPLRDALSLFASANKGSMGVADLANRFKIPSTSVGMAIARTRFRSIKSDPNRNAPDDEGSVKMANKFNGLIRVANAELANVRKYFDSFNRNIIILIWALFPYTDNLFDILPGTCCVCCCSI